MIVGMFREPWTCRRLIAESLIFTVLGFHVALLLFMNGLILRYAFPLLPLFIIWAAKGIDETARWAKDTTANAHLSDTNSGNT